MTEEWREAKAEARGRDQKIWEYQRGYRVREAGKHEDEKAFRAFQHYLNSAGARSMTGTAEACGNSAGTVAKWYDTYQWAKRCAAWDKQQMAITFREANKLERQRHRKNIQEFRQANEDQDGWQEHQGEDEGNDAHEGEEETGFGGLLGPPDGDVRHLDLWLEFLKFSSCT